MTGRHEDDVPAAVSTGDGTLGGPAIGGSVSGPDAGVIHDPVGRELAVPVDVEPEADAEPGDVTDDPTGETDPLT
jgi:hypothetical protein